MAKAKNSFSCASDDDCESGWCSQQKCYEKTFVKKHVNWWVVLVLVLVVLAAISIFTAHRTKSRRVNS